MTKLDYGFGKYNEYVGDIDGVQKELLPKILSTEEKLVVEFALHLISYRIGDESYRHRILNALPKNRKQSFFLSKQSFFSRISMMMREKYIKI
ncbi:hypothetical protein RFI36_12390 [Acinetobacter gerneri]|uniref:Uncharacterized protein n=1 Tax=Acinetobacter gerneri TaxID=202952 RepID=A0AAW8JQ71_9GAMM|nr:hypothetical protein [Acinetobacter gerneri]MDQ9010442.1 hypothetical protein [Acinetobacter gerneri]MDQ9014641.1 hypothetical protein [Acinetobacter gerneri]MDQ9025884.1 hypothetical protein [Acinetobacter gerneri]MDQ9053093.1 hypothetical protein [Acinetobacter gerneri]MDQ9060711.1 hypothetical protein [Acinetobacter gerneri]